MLSKIKNWVIALWQIIRQILLQPTNALWAVLVALASFFLWALVADKGGAVARLLEIDSKAEVLRLIGWGMGGVLAAIGVIALNRRAAALDKQNSLTKKGNMDERFKTAVQNLGGERASGRIAAFYQFYYLAKDNIDKNFKNSILEILCAHLRQMTRFPSKVGSYPTEECQSMLDILFRRAQNIFAGMEANLSGADIGGADLRDAQIQRAKFENTTISNADFWHANVSGTDFSGADASKAYFYSTDVQHASFDRADLRGADFSHAKNMETASFKNIKMDAKTKFPEGFREGEHYTVAKEEE